MRPNKILGLIFSNTYDQYLNELTSLRSMGSVPFGGRYRLIDFQLSAMVNSGIGKVGVITKSNYQSLMDHVGNGRSWDLARKNGGLYILPPFSSTGSTGLYNNKIQALYGSADFLRHSEEEYVLMTDCNTVYNIDLTEMFDFHNIKNADITIAYAKGKKPNIDELMSFELDENGRISTMFRGDSDGAYSLNVVLMRKALLEKLINEAAGLNYSSFADDIIGRNLKSLKIYGYEFGGFVRVLDGMQSYFDTNMELLKSENRKALLSSRPVYTKVKDDVPAIYGLNSSVSNSLIADGCVIEGEVENSILFRGVHIGKGSVVKNCVLMQNTYISDNVNINCVVADKNVVIKPNKMLSGDAKYPLCIGKGIVI
ncbi:MAG: glucose-1-phosphate adenylyltransferase subunit GlgD [Clostridia bacterium]|nr:glucose-1-phosphate adenylyltransferase subunit GlgD [Clostridia bacterium]